MEYFLGPRKFPRRSLVTRCHGSIRPWMSPPAASAAGPAPAPPDPGDAGHSLFCFEGAIPTGSFLAARAHPAVEPRRSFWSSGAMRTAALRLLSLGALLENCIASTSVLVMCGEPLPHVISNTQSGSFMFCTSGTRRSVRFQATKSQRWMPWRQMPMKDVGGCEKLREAADQALIRRYPNGETRLGSCPVTSA